MTKAELKEIAKTELLAKINKTNNATLTTSDVSISDPSVVTNVDVLYSVSKGNNSFVDISAASTSSYRGSIRFYYNRIDLNDIISHYDTTLDKSSWINFTTTTELIANIASQTGLIIDISDVDNTSLPPVDFSEITKSREVELTANSDSYRYYGAVTLNLSPSFTPTVDSDNLVQQVYVELETTDASEAKDHILAVDSKGNVNNTFVYLSNIQQMFVYQVDKTVYLNDGSICHLGTFSFNTKLDTLITIDSKWIIVDKYGALIKHGTMGIFSTGTLHQNSKHDYIYEVTDSDGYLVRYDQSGLLDEDFTSTLTFIPECVFLNDDGKVYAVSKSYWMGSVDNVTTESNGIKVVRLNTNGSIDTTFKTTAITNSIPSTVAFGIHDIKESPSGYTYIALYARCGVSSDVATPVVNNDLLVTRDFNFGLTGWLPVIRLDNNGDLDTTFDVTKVVRHPDNIYCYYNINSTPMTHGTHCLSVANEVFTLTVNISSNATGFMTRKPVIYSYTGELLKETTISDNCFITSIDKVISLHNGKTLCLCKLALTTDGVITDHLTAVVLCNKTGETTVLYGQINKPLVGVGSYEYQNN